jgi:hypothetical protein
MPAAISFISWPDADQLRAIAEVVVSVPGRDYLQFAAQPLR